MIACVHSELGLRSEPTTGWVPGVATLPTASTILRLQHRSRDLELTGVFMSNPTRCHTLSRNDVRVGNA
jgi:hypothetical protein